MKELSPLPPRVSVLVPAYNEAENMAELFAELASTIRKHEFQTEIVLVDDGSTDGTAEAAHQAAADTGLEPDTGVYTIISHHRNLGKTDAILTGARVAQGEYLVLFDADLQHSTEEIPRFVEELDKGYDLVAGRKLGGYEKQLVSGIYNRLAARIFKVPARDLNSMKAFRAGVLDGLTLRRDWHRYLVVLAHARGARVGELDIALHPRRHGESKYSGRGRIVIGTLDLVAVWFQLVFGRKPMLFFGVPGAVFLLLGVATGVASAVLRWGFDFGYRPLLTLVLLFITSGLVLFLAGFLGEMVTQIRDDLDRVRRELSERR